MGEKGAGRGGPGLEEQSDSVALRRGRGAAHLSAAGGRGLQGAWRWFWKAGDASL